MRASNSRRCRCRFAQGRGRSPSRLYYSVLEAAEILGVGRTQVFACIKEGQLRKTKSGKRTLIHKDDLYDFSKRLHESYEGASMVSKRSDAAKKEEK